MKLALLLLVLAPAAAFATGASCAERCMGNLQRCSSGCAQDLKCPQRCQRHFDSCNDSCRKAGEIQEPKIPRKCPGRKGKMVPCSDYEMPKPPAK